MSAGGFEWLVRRIVAVYSRRFRESLGEDMVRALVAEMQARRERGRSAAWWYGARTVASLVAHGIANRVRARTRRGEAGRGGGGGLGAVGGRRRREPGALRRLGDALRQRWPQATARIWRSPGLAVGMTAAFAIGIGANATMFGVADRLLLSPPPRLEDAGRLRLLAVETYSARRGERVVSPIRSYPELEDWRGAESIAGIAGYQFNVRELTVGRGESARRLRTLPVTGGYFALLGTRPVLGRLLEPRDDRVGAPGTVVISEAVWRRDYGGSPDVLGRTIDFGRGPHTIVGVAPRGFTGVELAPVDAWIPLAPYRRAISGAEWNLSRRRHWLKVVARLAPGVSEEYAVAELTTLHRSARADDIVAGRYPRDAEVVVASVVPGKSPLRPAEVDVARWLAGISLVLLLLACVNVANLLLARQVRDRRETAVRRALGATRWRIAGDLAAESVILALLGAAAAVVVGHVGGTALGRLLLPNVEWQRPSVPAALIAAAACLGVIAGVAVSLLPTLRAFQPEATAALRSSGSTPAASRTRGGLAVAQIALSAVLLVGAALFVRSFTAAVQDDLGIDPEDAYILSPVLDGVPDADREAVLRRGLERLEPVPGVASAGASSTVPFYQLNGAPLRAEGWDSIPGRAMVHAVAGDYFDALGLTVAAGRLLDDSDGPGAPRVAVVNRAMAERLWTSDAVGRCLYVGAGETRCTEVVGVVESARISGIGTHAPMQYYVPARQQAPAGGLWVLLARLRPDAGPRVSAAVRRAVLGSDPRIRFVEVEPVEAVLDHQLRPWRLGATVFSAFGALALLLAAIGLHALLAFDASQRRRELGIRSALGATARVLLGRTIRRGLGLAAAGVALGGALAYLLTPRMEDLLFRIPPRDPGSFAIVAAVLVVAALAASVLPARRAARTDPAEVLRSDA